MVTVVVVINIFISLLLLFIAWQVWNIKQRIAWVADRLTAYEKCCDTWLSQAPVNLGISQQNLHNLRQSNQSLQLRIQLVRQIVSLLLLGQRYFPKGNPVVFRKTVTKTAKNSGNIYG
ncbi:hypothetical protein H6G76_01885 [Nostoc sp. FACHB-152]|uniref:hypothetical protein n=1 Tax=unclassified Nostoc TaxID=2593658 RepID=UPI001684B53B|nr:MULTISPECIES: hypothetical protein [unclassified Nostoc]MBD2445922.1 hypothetical protein [Nostoc sp. FACHB-152]MBD2467902.1 hypothetical protein [Nostoc sp. FACHB-145]